LSHRDRVARALASAFLAGEWNAAGLRARAERVFDLDATWLELPIAAALSAFPEPPRDARDSLARLLVPLLDDARLLLAPPVLPRVRRWLVDEPASGARRWPVPRLATSSELATWLGVTSSQLDWFADPRGTAARSTRPTLQHYRYAWIAKSRGGHRLLEIPRSRLKAMQRKILTEILDVIPPHDAVHGFRRGRSALGHATQHAGRAVVIRMDLEEFFPSTPTGRVYGLFRAAGYPETVARLLTWLTTHRTPPAALRDMPRGNQPASDGSHALEASERWRSLRRLASRHLPQGAPTSPALANLCAFRLDRRLESLAVHAGARYSRYADDLAFSGDEPFAHGAARLVERAHAVIVDEGYRPNTRKTRVMRTGSRQELMGLSINVRPNVARTDYDQLKAVLTNCVRHGPSTQNRDAHEQFRAHLEGRAAWISFVNPLRGPRLHALLAAIDWSR